MFSFSSINKNRKLLFGIATLWIAWFHSFDLIFSVNEKITFLNLGNLLSFLAETFFTGFSEFLYCRSYYFMFFRNLEHLDLFGKDHFFGFLCL